MRHSLLSTALLAMMLVVQLDSWSCAGEGQYSACADCGCSCACERVCRLVCEEKKVTVVCWGCLCEDFCLPRPSHVRCEHCGEVCGECQHCDPKVPHSLPKSFVWKEWTPGCPTGIHTKKKLMRQTITKTVPSFKWVVEDVCPACDGKYIPPQISAEFQVPPPPKVTARVISARRRASGN